MSGGLAPSKSTVYVGNLPYSLTNNDLHKIFEKYGRVIKVTIVRDKQTRLSKGVAFILFLEKESAQKCVRALDRQELFGRTLKCSLAKDNGRTTEFIRRKVYKDKSSCYECGETGHLSYECPKNSLGDREPPEKKEKKDRKRKFPKSEQEVTTFEEEEEEDEEECVEENVEDPTLESLSAAIQYQQEKVEEEAYRYKVATGNYTEQSSSSTSTFQKKRKIKKSSYFSDDEEEDDDN